MQADLDFDIVMRSGLTQQEFADLAKVSRITAIYWIKGQRKPSKHTYERTAEILKRLDLALSTGTLPLTTPPPRKGNIMLSPEQKQALSQQRKQEIHRALTK